MIPKLEDFRIDVAENEETEYVTSGRGGATVCTTVGFTGSICTSVIVAVDIPLGRGTWPEVTIKDFGNSAIVVVVVS